MGTGAHGGLLPAAGPGRVGTGGRRGDVHGVVQAGAVTFEWPFMLWGLALIPVLAWVYTRLFGRPPRGAVLIPNVELLGGAAAGALPAGAGRRHRGPRAARGAAAGARQPGRGHPLDGRQPQYAGRRSPAEPPRGLEGGGPRVYQCPSARLPRGAGGVQRLWD